MLYLDIGRRENGKTTLAMFMARNVERRLIFDPRGLIRIGATVTSPDALALAYAELRDGDRVDVVYTPRGDVIAGFQLFARYMADWVTRFPSRPLAVVIDEAAFVKRAQGDPNFLWSLRCSKRSVFHVWMTAHRPIDITTDVRAIADYWLLFACRQEQDLELIEERCGPTVLEAVQRLGPREWVYWDDTQVAGVMRLYRNPETWYVDLDSPAAWTSRPPAGLGVSETRHVDRLSLFH